MTVNAHRAFNSTQEQSFLKRLKVPHHTNIELRAARDDIRKAIRVGLAEWKKALNNDTERLSHPSFTPNLGSAKFRMQGSQVYHTANDPEQKPPQEIDLDDGMFLPVTFFTNNGTEKPALISAMYFKAVEAALGPLCDKNNWKLNIRKASCVRVQINNECHVDIALYAVPDGEFKQLIESKSRLDNALTFDEEMKSIELFEDVYQRITAGQMMLAHRKTGWMPSDPRQLEEWFKEAVATKGDQVRFVSRYLKAWRDKEWESCRLSSIALMSATVSVFQEHPKGFFQDRDDLALLAVSESLPRILSQRIPNPRVPAMFLDDGWNSIERADFVDRAKDLHSSLHDAISVSVSPVTTIEKIRERLGYRFPNDVTLISDAKNNSDSQLPATRLTGLFQSENAHDRPPVQQRGDERYG